MTRSNTAVFVSPAESLTVSCTLWYTPADVGVPVKTMFAPLTVAVRPGGMLDWETLNVPAPPLTGITPLKPDCPTVHWFAVSDPSVMGATIVMLQATPAVTPAASTTLTWRLYEPAVVGVPPRVMVLPLSDAVTPEGRPTTAKLLNGPVPP